MSYKDTSIFNIYQIISESFYQLFPIQVIKLMYHAGVKNPTFFRWYFKGCSKLSAVISEPRFSPSTEIFIWCTFAESALVGASACRQGQLLLQRRRWTEGFARSLIRSQSLSKPLDLKVKGNAERHKAKKGQNTKHVTCNYFHPWNANILLCSSFSILFSSLLGSSSEKWFSKKRNHKNQINFIC